MNYYTQSRRPVAGASGLWSWITGVDLEAETERGQILDEALYQENVADLNSGHYTPSIYEIAEANRLRGAGGDATEQVSDTFTTSVREDIGDAISGVVGGTFSLIPWQAWAVGAVVAAVILYPKFK